MIIFQVWQGPPFCPPLKVHLVNLHDEYHLAVSVRNNITGSNPAPAGKLCSKEYPLKKANGIAVSSKLLIRHHNMAEPGEVEALDRRRSRRAEENGVSWTGPDRARPVDLSRIMTDGPMFPTLDPEPGTHIRHLPRATKATIDFVFRQRALCN